MKFRLTLINDENKVVRSHNLCTWYADEGLQKNIHDNGIESLNHIVALCSNSVKEEIYSAIEQLITGQES